MRTLVLDQNVPKTIAPWLSERLPGWSVRHVKTLGLAGEPDEDWPGSLIIIDNNKIWVRRC